MELRSSKVSLGDLNQWMEDCGLPPFETEPDALTRELAQERALVRSWIEKAEATRASVEALLVLNQDLRARTDDAESAVTTLEWQLSEANKESERLLVSEATLEHINRWQASEIERLKAAVVEIGAAHVAAQAEIERLKTALYQVSRSANYIDNLAQQTLDKPNCLLGRANEQRPSPRTQASLPSGVRNRQPSIPLASHHPLDRADGQ